MSFSTIVAPSREEALGLAEKYRDAVTFDRAATLAWTQAQVQLHHLGIGPDEAHLFQSLARRVLFLDRTLRPSADVLTRDTGGPAALWPHGISGDIPIVLVQIDDPDDVGIVRQLLRAHEYWRMKQLAVDLVILNERAPSYVQDLQSLLETLVRTSQSAAAHEGHAPHGSVFILRADRITPSQRDALLTVARAVLSNRRGTLAEQITREQRPETPPVAPLRRPPATRPPPEPQLPRPELEIFNGLGGFAADGREYVTILEAGQATPAPWINVISNPVFGFQVSESGSGYTWSINSRENQLTPWSNDPVDDAPGEAIYVRDEESGELWSPTALPIREAGQPYMARHGQGYSRFEHVSHGISLELLQFVPLEDPIKVSRLTVRNASGRRRRLSVTAYVEWVLGVSRSASAPFIVTEIDPDTKAMIARNTWASDFGGRVAFADLGGAQTAWTGDRTEFLGRNGVLDRPAALIREGRLSGRVGPGLDPCGALQTILELRAGERADVVFFLGEAATREEAGALIARYRTADLDAAAAGGRRALGRRAWRGPGEDAGPVHGPAAQPLAALPDARVPGLVALGLLSGGRSLWIPRPAPGRDGAVGGDAGNRARAHPSSRGPPVRGGRRAALVAPALRPRRSHADLRRCGLAAVRHPALSGHHGRRGGAGRGRPLPRRADARDGAGGILFSARRVIGAGDPLRALRPRARPGARRRGSRASLDRHGRLE